MLQCKFSILKVFSPQSSYKGYLVILALFLFLIANRVYPDKAP